MKDAPLDLLPVPGVRIAERFVRVTSGPIHHHVYAATGRPTIEVPLAGPPEIEQAVAAARRALPQWRATPPSVRRGALMKMAQGLRERASELATVQTIENSTPAMISAGGVELAAEYFEYNAGWADKIGGEVVPAGRGFDYSLDEPYGVVAVIPTWNGPVGMLGMVCAPALAAGNTLVVKPSELTPFTSLIFAEVALEAGLPPGVVNVVPASAEAGSFLVRHPQVDKIHFTGSGATARRILADAAQNLTPVSLELGGKSALLVFRDCDVDVTVAQVVSTLAVLSGQVCIAGTRILVEGALYDTLVERIAGAVGSIPIGDPLEASTLMGPVISEAACSRILGVVERAKTGGARLVVGGERMSGGFADGFYVEPTVFADVDNASELAQQEVFGPVVAMQRFDTEEEAVGLANASVYGLAAYVNTNDLRRAHRVASALDTGNVWINGVEGIPVAAPFGGTKQSGIGRLGGIHGIREFVRPKNVWSAP